LVGSISSTSSRRAGYAARAPGINLYQPLLTGEISDTAKCHFPVAIDWKPENGDEDPIETTRLTDQPLPALINRDWPGKSPIEENMRRCRVRRAAMAGEQAKYVKELPFPPLPISHIIVEYASPSFAAALMGFMVSG
jgi:hypothetical protein